MREESIFELKRRFAAGLRLPNPDTATTQQILDSIANLPRDSMVHPDDMRDYLRDHLPEGDPDLALFAT